jgi:DNA polymerase-4
VQLPAVALKGEKCPHLIVVPARFDLCRAESERIRAIFLEHTPLVEPLSLDEAYLDVSHLSRPATETVRKIRARITSQPAWHKIAK